MNGSSAWWRSVSKFFSKRHRQRRKNQPQRGAAKLKRLTELYGEKGFDYAGNSSVDIPVWRGAAEAIVVNARPWRWNGVPAKCCRKRWPGHLSPQRTGRLELLMQVDWWRLIRRKILKVQRHGKIMPPHRRDHVLEVVPAFAGDANGLALNLCRDL